jgi:hypothetical protein
LFFDLNWTNRRAGIKIAQQQPVKLFLLNIFGREGMTKTNKDNPDISCTNDCIVISGKTAKKTIKRDGEKQLIENGFVIEKDCEGTRLVMYTSPDLGDYDCDIILDGNKMAIIGLSAEMLLEVHGKKELKAFGFKINKTKDGAVLFMKK